MLDGPANARPEGRLAERALVLTVVTLVLLTPPILTIFDVATTVAGIPLLHVYCFAVWLLAIILGGRLATRMEPGPAGADPTAPPATGEG
jgi:hypothetical protein